MTDKRVDLFWAFVAVARRAKSAEAYATAISIYRDGSFSGDSEDEFFLVVEEYAGLLEAAGDLSGAAEAVRLLTDASPFHADSQAGLARIAVLAEGGERAAGLWEQVGDRRVQAGDPGGALSAFDQALESVSRTQEGRIHRKCASAWLMRHEVDEAQPHLAAAAALGPDPAESGRLLGVRAALAVEAGDLAGAQELASRAHSVARDCGDAEGAAVSGETLAVIAHLRGNWRPELHELPSVWDFNHCLSQSRLYEAGDPGGYARRIVADGAAPGQAFAWCLLGESLLLRAEWDEAAACLERSCAVYESLSDRSPEFPGSSRAPVALPWLRRAELAACIGDHAEAAALLERATAIATETPMPRHAWARLHATAAFAAMERGSASDAIRSVRAVQSAAARHGECPTCSAVVNPVGAQAYALVGAVDSAQALAVSAERLAGLFPGSGWSAMADSAGGWALLAAGDGVGAGVRFRSAAAGYAEAGHRFWAERSSLNALR
ncbi:hypothetical protein ACQP2E_06530 [Actinoplanes sp. CA-015351]|uniref:hypothetical protein n=1 Tax=Actinoplanes sp. CA-015351 TaxID=3239897 RepID=UPI003D991149